MDLLQSIADTLSAIRQLAADDRHDLEIVEV